MMKTSKFYEQETDYTCAIACIRMVLHDLDHPIVYDELSITVECNTVPSKGTHPDDIVKYFERLGYQAKYKSGGTIDDLERFRKQGYSIIMIVSVDVPHCVVYRGHNNNHFFFDDPWYGENKSRTIKKFEKGGNYPLMRWEVETKSLKKYYPDVDLSGVESYTGTKQYILIHY